MTKLTKILVSVVKFYQTWLSPLKPPCCRFFPTCSTYAITALEKYGWRRGSFLTIKRVLRCNPFCKGGYDPVP